MELNEIKKALYREKPIAYFVRATKENLIYESTIIETYGEFGNRVKNITFSIPLNEIGDANFERNMADAQLLIRYIIK